MSDYTPNHNPMGRRGLDPFGASATIDSRELASIREAWNVRDVAGRFARVVCMALLDGLPTVLKPAAGTALTPSPAGVPPLQDIKPHLKGRKRTAANQSW